MLDFADLVAVNKSDKRGALDALRDVRKQYVRNHGLWDAKEEDLPIFGTIASQFNDPGMNSLYKAVMEVLKNKGGADLKSTFEISDEMEEKVYIIPPARTRYLSEIAENNRNYDARAKEQSAVARQLYGIYLTLSHLIGIGPDPGCGSDRA